MNEKDEEIGEGWWYEQLIQILTKCIEDLVYAHENNYFNAEQMKEINMKGREFSDLIPDFDTVFKKNL